MTPKEALDHIGEDGCGHEIKRPLACETCEEALSVPRALVEGPTVAEVREEIEKKITTCKERAYNAELANSWSDLFRCEGAKSELYGLLDFIDRKEA